MDGDQLSCSQTCPKTEDPYFQASTSNGSRPQNQEVSDNRHGIGAFVSEAGIGEW